MLKNNYDHKTILLAFTKTNDVVNIKKDIEQDVQRKLEPFRESLYTGYRLGLVGKGFLFSKFNSIEDTIWATTGNAYIEPLCEIGEAGAEIEQYTKSKDSLDYDVMTNFDFVDRIDFTKAPKLKELGHFYYIKHDGELLHCNDKESVSQFMDYINCYQKHNPRLSLYVTVVELIN